MARVLYGEACRRVLTVRFGQVNLPGLDGQVDGSPEGDQVDFGLVEDGDLLSVWRGEVMLGGRKGRGARATHLLRVSVTTLEGRGEGSVPERPGGEAGRHTNGFLALLPVGDPDAGWMNDEDKRGHYRG